MDISKEKYALPYSCQINLTNKCNLRCKHCFGNYSKKANNELNLEEWKKVIDDLVSSGVFYINISGGEPTKCKFFKEFILYLEKKGMHFILTTNGVFSKNIRNFILDHKEYLIGIKISLDGPDAVSHCFIRLDMNENFNPQVFDITLENIKFFSEKRVSLTITTVLHKKNIDKMGKFQKLISEINPTSWFVSPIVPLGRGNENWAISKFYEYYDPNFWGDITSKGKKKGINVHLIDTPINKGREGVSAYTCSGAITSCEINADGIVAPCSLSRVCIPKEKIKFENITKKPLKDIWNGKPFNKFRSYMNIGCEGCEMLPKCNKCIAQSFRYFGDGKSPTPFCIKQGKKTGLKDLEKYKKILEDKFSIKIKC